MTRIFRGCLVAAALLVGAAVLPLPAPIGAPAALADGPAPIRAQANYEIRYMELTIDHHAMGVMMAMVGLEKATDPRLIAISQTIIMDQSAEIDLLQGYLHDWYGIDYEPQMTPGDQRMLDRLASLPMGEEFDVEYSEMFARHHVRIIRRSEQALTHVYHTALMMFAMHVIVEQSGDIENVFEPVLALYGELHHHFLHH